MFNNFKSKIHCMFNFRSLLTPAPQFENIEETLIIAFKKVNTKYLVWRPKNCTFLTFY